MKTGRRGFFRLIGAAAASTQLPEPVVAAPVIEPTAAPVQGALLAGNYAVVPRSFSVGCNGVVVFWPPEEK